MHGVQEVVVDASVDHVHRLAAAGGAHPHHAVATEEVAALDELDAHPPGQEGVLEVRGVVHPGGEHHHGRLGDAQRARRRAAPPSSRAGYSSTLRSR